MLTSSDTVDVAVLEPPGSERTHLPVGLGVAAERRDGDVSMNTVLARAVTDWSSGSNPHDPATSPDIGRYELTLSGGGLLGSETTIRLWQSETDASRFDTVVDGLFEDQTNDRDTAAVYENQSEGADPNQRMAVLARTVDLVLGTIPADRFLDDAAPPATSGAEFTPAGIPAYEVLYRSTSLPVVPVLTHSRAVLQADQDCAPAAASTLRSSIRPLDQLLGLTDEPLYPVNLPSPEMVAASDDAVVEGFDHLLKRVRD